MKVRSWLSTCSSTTSTTTATATTTTTESEKTLLSTTSNNSSDIQTQYSSSSISSSTSNSSIQTNLSLLTLPSVPSLQKLTFSPETSANHLSATAVFTASLKPRRAHVNFLVIHNNLLYAASGNEINVYDIVNNTTLFDTFKVEKISSGSVKHIAFCNKQVFTSHQDCKIRVWKLNLQKRHKLIATLPTLKDRLRRSVLPQNYVRIRRHKKKLWIEHQDAVSGLASDKNSVLSISWDKSLKIWEAQKFKCLKSINKAHEDAINAVLISKDGIIYTCSADKQIKVWKKDERNYRLIATLEKHKSAVNALALNLDGSVLFSGSCDRSILVWEREDSANHMGVVGALRGHAKAVLCLINVQDLLLSGSADRTVRIWRRGLDGRYCCLNLLDGHQTPVRSLAAVAENAADGCECGGVKVFSGGFDGEIKVWQVEVSIVTGPSMFNNYDKT